MNLNNDETITTEPNLDPYIIKSKRSKRKFSAAQKQAYCQQWQNSNLGKAEFCKQNNLSPKTFYNWIRNYAVTQRNTVTPANPAKSFLPVTCAKMPTNNKEAISIQNNADIKLYVSNDIVLALPESIEPNYLLQILRGIRDEASN